MRSKMETHSDEAEKRVRDIRRATRRQFSAEEKVRIVIAGLRGEDSVAELCRKEGINQNLYYRSWASRSAPPPSGPHASGKPYRRLLPRFVGQRPGSPAQFHRTRPGPESVDMENPFDLPPFTDRSDPI
jgi:transposase